MSSEPTRRGPAVSPSGETTRAQKSDVLRSPRESRVETWVGRSVGEVRIESLLGRGGMADVYLGRHGGLNRPVAVKILHEPMRRDPAMMKFFRDEAVALTNMQHPNIVHCIDCNVIMDRPYIVMELVDGITLQERLAHLRALGLAPPLHIVHQVVRSAADALDHAHARGIVHRDGKPANIMLLGSDRQLRPDLPLPADVQVVVADFGLAQLAHATLMTADEAVIGTPAYMSPEQISGGVVDSRSDVYALGVVLYEMLAGRVPFLSDMNSMVEIFHGHTHRRPPPVPNLAIDIRRVVDRALAKDPSARFIAAGELAAALEAAIDSRTIAGQAPS